MIHTHQISSLFYATGRSAPRFLLNINQHQKQYATIHTTIKRRISSCCSQPRYQRSLFAPKVTTAATPNVRKAQTSSSTATNNAAQVPGGRGQHGQFHLLANVSASNDLEPPSPAPAITCTSTSINETNKSGVVPCPVINPPGFERRAEQSVFDSALHLQLEKPAYINVLRNDGKLIARMGDVDVGPRQGEDLAYTAPFRVLSDEGVRAFRRILDESDDMAITTKRNPKVLRGLGYTSDFVKQLNYSPQLLAHLQEIANTLPALDNNGDSSNKNKKRNTGLSPDPFPMNLSQINYGEVPSTSGDGDGKMVDVWHLDSVDYVLVLLLSETPRVGGDLLVAHMEAGEALEQVRRGAPPKDVTVRTEYPGPGYAIFMQGSKIAHAVTSVKEASEARITCINSYSSMDPHRPHSTTCYDAFKISDPISILDNEYVRAIAWKTALRLNHMVANPHFDDARKHVADLDHCIDRLQRVRNAIAPSATTSASASNNPHQNGSSNDAKPFAL